MLVSTETGGLGNRIKSWVSVMRLDPEARVHWEITPNMPARFSDLFENDCHIETIPPSSETYKSWRLAILPDDETHIPDGFSSVNASTHPITRGLGKAWWTVSGKPTDRYRYMVFPKQHSKRSARADARHIDLEYERIPVAVRDAYRPFFSRISVREDLAKRVEEWAATNVNDKTVGVQIRTWRDEPRRYRKYHLPAAKRLERLMRETDPEAQFLIVSDSDEVIEKISRAYGAERILSFPRNTLRTESWQSPEGVQEDLIDMLVLARTRHLFASYLSTFSEAAWWLGGATAKVWVF